MFTSPKTYMEDAYPHGERLREKILDDVEFSEEPGKPNHFKTLSVGNTVLETDTEQARRLVSEIVDPAIKTELELSGAANWCRTAKPLLPLKTIGDGNCLLHAISLFLWGIQDNFLALRRLLYMTLSSDQSGTIERRWRHERGYVSENVPGLRLNTRDWEEEWDVVVMLGDDMPQSRRDDLPYRSLEEIHVFVMANILRRPIIILCDQVYRSAAGHSIQPNNFGGIYLPLDWQAKQCCKHPIVLGYHMNHFAPLVSQTNRVPDNLTSVQALHVIPLVHKDLTSLRLHFLLPGEEGRVTEWLHGYLKIREIALTREDGVVNILAASLNVTALPSEINVVQYFTQHNQQRHCQAEVNATPTKISANMIGVSQPVREQLNLELLEQQYYGVECVVEGCSMTGLPETNGMCSKCFADFSKRDAETEAAKRQMPRKPSAPLMRVDPLDENMLISIPVQITEETTPVSHLYVKPHGGKSCAYEVCTNPVSSLGGDLCHLCINTLRSMSPPQRVTQQAVGKTDQSELFGSGNTTVASASGTNGQQKTTRTKCLTEGCTKAGKDTQRNLCARCYMAFKETAPLRTPEPVSEHQVNVPPTSEGATSPQQIVELSETVEIPPGSVTQAQSETETLKRLCANPGCSGERRDNPLGLCTSCYQSTRRTTDLQLSPQGAGRIGSSSPAGEVEQEQVEQSWAESVSSPEVIVCDEQKIRCVSPVCSNFVFPPKQLCDNCVETLTRARVKQARCRKDGCKFHGAPNFGGYCSKCFSEIQRGQGEQTRRSSSDPQLGQASRSQQLSVRRNRALDIEPQQRAHSAPIASRGKPCVVSGCTRFGDPAMEDMCTRCYQRKYAIPSRPPYGALYTATPPAAVRAQTGNTWQVKATSGLVPSGSTSTGYPNQFVQNMARLETGRKSPRCQNERIGCPNFGSPLRQGYCTSCYDALRGEDVVDTSRHMTQVANLTLTM